MAFDGATPARPLYRLDLGIPGNSHALDIASRVGTPEAVVVTRARAAARRRATARSTT
jgi:dsDNA-specific endonuclease/ATPase MutS2